ncbi:MAG: lysylphosphatidylglycerol synthase transmembrane domain-containing protein [Nanoarchaeota archaeon]
MKKLLKLSPLIGIILFAYIILNINLSSVIKIFSEFNVLYLGLAFVISLFFSIPKSWKWKMLIKSCGIYYSLREAVLVYFISGFIALVTPGRIGEFVKGFYLKESSKSTLGKSISTVLADRIIDIFILILMALGGIFVFSFLYNIGTTYMIVIASLLIAFVAVAVLAINKKYTQKILRPIFYRFIPEKYKSKIKVNFDEFYSGIEMIRNKKGTLIVAALLTVFIWIGAFFQFWLLAVGLNIELSFLVIILIYPVIMILEMVPISFTGIGTREAVLILFFMIIGLSAAEAVSFSLMVLIYQYLAVLPGLFFWFKKPVKI